MLINTHGQVYTHTHIQRETNAQKHTPDTGRYTQYTHLHTYLPTYLHPHLHTYIHIHRQQSLTTVSTMGFSCFCIECVDTATLGIMERFGNFTSVLAPGFNLICWPVDSVVGRVSGRVQQLACECGTKTKDNVFVFVNVVVQYQVCIYRMFIHMCLLSVYV